MQPASSASEADPYDGDVDDERDEARRVGDILKPFGEEEMAAAARGYWLGTGDDLRWDSEDEAKDKLPLDVFDLKLGQLEEVLAAIRWADEHHRDHQRAGERWCQGMCNRTAAEEARWTILRLLLLEAPLHERLDDAEQFHRECRLLRASGWGTQSLILRVRELAADPARLVDAFSGLLFELTGWLGSIVRFALSLGKYHLAGRLLRVPDFAEFLRTEGAEAEQEAIVDGLVAMLRRAGEAPEGLELCRARLFHVLQGASQALIERLIERLDDDGHVEAPHQAVSAGVVALVREYVVGPGPAEPPGPPTGLGG
jgi:hypothetical protein